MHIKQVSLFKKGYMITNEATLKLRWKKALREKCPYLELFWSSFFRIWTQYEEVRLIFSPNTRKYGPEKLWIRSPFTQWSVAYKKSVYICYWIATPRSCIRHVNPLTNNYLIILKLNYWFAEQSNWLRSIWGEH